MNDETHGKGDDLASTDWSAILNASDDHSPWICLTPERVACLSLEDCLYQIDRAVVDVDRLALAAKAAHLSLQAALTAALSGSASIGAYPAKLRDEYLQFFEDSRFASMERPLSDRVMGFCDLLETAIREPLPWTQTPLEVNEGERELLDRLTVVRHAVEHPKQSRHSIEPAYIAKALPVAARLTTELLASVSHHLEPGCLASVKLLAGRIFDMSSRYSV